MNTLHDMKALALLDLYNEAVIDYAPPGFAAVSNFKSKAQAVEKIDAMCAAGNLAIMFDGDAAVIIDNTPKPSPAGDTVVDVSASVSPDFIPADEDGGEGEGESEGGDEAPAFGDGKGAVAPSGFVRSSDDWLKANERGTAAREAYRKARRKAASMARKAAQKAKQAAREVATA